VADGDTVVRLGYEGEAMRAAGRRWKAHFTHTVTFSGGKIIAHRQYNRHPGQLGCHRKDELSREDEL
jgi:ketosteroid isomerase-like protein